MSAGDRWHEHGAVKDGDPTISAAVLLWMRGQGSAERSALPWQVDPEGAFDGEPAAAGGAESEDVLANLLRAIENTEVAARLRSAAPADKGHPSADTWREPVETAEAASRFAKPLEPGAVAEPTPAAPAESSEALAMLLRAIQSTEVAAKLESAPRADRAEATPSGGALPAQMAETLSAAPQEPEKDATAHREVAPQVAPEAGDSPAVALRAIQSSDANLSLNGVPPASEKESARIASSEPVEATFVLEAPVARPLRSTTKQENGPPKRAARRRLSGRERLDYLRSIAARAAAPAPGAAEPQPSAPLPVDAAKVVAKPERPSSARSTRSGDALRPLAAADDATPKAPMLARLGTGIGSLAATGDIINEGLNRAEMHLETWFQKWFGPPDPRHDMRVENPPLVAYHWIADVPQALKIADVSAGGLHLITKDRWSEGNIISMTLQRTDRVKGSPDSWIAVDFLVMRWCEDGMAGAFMASSPGLNYTVAGRAANCANKKTLDRFMDRLIDASVDRMAVST